MNSGVTLVGEILYEGLGPSQPAGLHFVGIFHIQVDRVGLSRNRRERRHARAPGELVPRCSPLAGTVFFDLSIKRGLTNAQESSCRELVAMRLV